MTQVPRYRPIAFINIIDIHCNGVPPFISDAAKLLTHWGRVTHICVSKLTIFSSNNGLSPGRHQAIIWTNAGILLIGPLGTNFSEILIEIYSFSFKKMHLKMSSGKWRQSCLGLNVLKVMIYDVMRSVVWTLLSRTPGRARQAPGVWDRLISA